MDKMKELLKNKKAIVGIVAGIITLSVVLFLCFRKIPLEDIVVKQQVMEVNADEIVNPSLEFLPEKASNKSVTYKPEDENVVKVNEAGQLVAVNNGKTKVTVKSSENENISKEFEVVVNTKIASINGKPLDKYIEIGDEKQLEYEILPEKTVNKNVVWKSSDENIVTISDTGLMTAVGNGNATVTIQSEENPNIMGKIDVLVETQVSELFILNEEDTINKDKEMQLMIGCLPANAAQTTFTFTSSDGNVLTVGKTGLVKGIGVGEADVTLSSKNGKSTVKHIKVAENPETITINGGNISGYKGDTGKLEITCEPADSYAAGLTFSSDSECVSIDDTGSYTMNGAGTATITASVKDGPSDKITITCHGDRPAPSQNSNNAGGSVSVSVIAIDEYINNGDALGQIKGVIKEGNRYYNDSFEVMVINGRIQRANVYGAGASMYGLIPGNSGVFAELTMLLNGGATYEETYSNLQYRDYSNIIGERIRIYGVYTIKEIVYAR